MPSVGLPCRDCFPLRRLVIPGEDALVEIAATEQLLMRAEIDYLAVAHDQNLVRPADLAQSMRDQDRGAVRADRLDRALDLVLGRTVDRAGRVVEDQDARIG